MQPTPLLLFVEGRGACVSACVCVHRLEVSSWVRGSREHARTPEKNSSAGAHAYKNATEHAKLQSLTPGEQKPELSDTTGAPANIHADADYYTWWSQKPHLNMPVLIHLRKGQLSGKVRQNATGLARVTCCCCYRPPPALLAHGPPGSRQRA